MSAAALVRTPCFLTQAFPALRATVLDLPEVVQIAADLIAGQGAADKVGTPPPEIITLRLFPRASTVNFFGHVAPGIARRQYACSLVKPLTLWTPVEWSTLWT